MIIVKGRELLIPETERYIGTSFDSNAEKRMFRIARVSQSGTDLSGLTFYINLVADGLTVDRAVVSKYIDDEHIYLTWNITRAQLSVRGTVFACITGDDTNGTVRWSSFYEAFYTEYGLGENVESDFRKAVADITSLGNAIADEADTRRQNVDTLQAQIDEFTALPDGSTSGDAELTNIRVAYDGVTYPSAGDAVRGQFSDINSMLTDGLVKEVGTNLGYEYHLGAIRSYTAASELNAYTPSQSAEFFEHINVLSSAGTYGNIRTYKIPIDTIQTVYTTAAYQQVLSNLNYFVVTVTDSLCKHVVSIGQNHLLNRLVPSTLTDMVSYNASGAVSIDFAKIKKAYPAAKFIFLATAVESASSFVQWYLLRGYDVAHDLKVLDERVTALEQGDAVPVIVLPKKLYAVAGHQFVMYHSNYILCNNIDDYDIYYNTGITGAENMKRCFRFTPTAGQVGTYTCTVSLRSKQDLSVVTSKAFTIEVLAETAISSKKVMFIGDSLTQNGTYAAEIENNLSDGGLVSVGTMTSTPTIGGTQYEVKTEGRNGWSAYDYFSAAVSTVVNPFYNPTSGTFDFAYYMANAGVSAPDIVCINLGTNGVGDYTADVSRIQQMIESIHSYGSTIPVIVSLIAPGASQDGWGYKKIGMTGAAFKYNALMRDQAYIDAFDERSSYVGVSAPLVFLDTEYDMPTITQNVSARNTTQVTIPSDNAHPAEPGYLHFADAYYNTLLAWLQ